MSDELPGGASIVEEEYPNLWRAYAGLGAACAAAGPLDAKTQRLVKLALALGAGSEGAVHSHVRRALAEGITAQELHHVVLLAIPTLGLPRAVAALTWVRDLTAPEG